VRSLKRISLDWPDKNKLLLGFDEQGRPVWGQESDLSGYGLDLQAAYGDARPGTGKYSCSNLLVKGDNLFVLKVLAGEFKGTIQCIYLDPPFNAANGTLAYDDDLEHGLWLSMMKARLELVRGFLKETGLIFIHIGYEEKSYLKVLADEIFGRNNFISEISWQRAPQGRTVLGQGATFIPRTSEYLLVYAKDIRRTTVFNNKKVVLATDKVLKQYNLVLKIYSSPALLIDKVDQRGNAIRIYRIKDFTLDRLGLRQVRGRVAEWLAENKSRVNEICRSLSGDNLLQQAVSSALSGANLLKQVKKLFLLANYRYMVQSVSIQKESTFQQQLLANMPARDVLYLAEYIPSRGKRSGQLVRDYYLNGRKLLFLKDYSEIRNGQVYRRVDLNDFWTHDEINVTGIAKEGGFQFKRSKKPESLLQRVIEFATTEGDWVLDCFLGSGTTAAVAHKLGRKWIGIEAGEHAETICLPRLKNVVSGRDGSGISKAIGWQGGGGFCYYTLAKEK